ncbi:MAG: 3-oxoacyl-ACP reductase FabG [Hespellia sp.]|nr:3-oxoacyl-ACP reductase FabG [Hespellia sp.]
MRTKSVLITGASRGIGKACALAFARENEDYHIYINCRTSIDELENVCQDIEELGSPCTMVVGDISNPRDVAAIYETIKKDRDALDILINNSGISHIGLLSDMSVSEWDHIIQTNLSSVFYCSKACIPDMVRQKSGRIINISSMWGRVGASCEVAYSASKAGVNGLTKALAKELAPSNIQVNAIACGVIDTDMNSQLSDMERVSLAEEIPMGRFGTPDEVADFVLQLIKSPLYMTGQVIGLDGGFI